MTAFLFGACAGAFVSAFVTGIHFYSRKMEIERYARLHNITFDDDPFNGDARTCCPMCHHRFYLGAGLK